MNMTIVIIHIFQLNKRNKIISHAALCFWHSLDHYVDISCFKSYFCSFIWHLDSSFFFLLIWQTERHFSESFSRTPEFIRRLIYCFVSSRSLLHGMMTLSGSCCLLALKVKLPSSLIPFSNLIHFLWTQIMLLLLISAWTRSYHCLGRPISVLADSCCEAMSDDVLTAAINVYSKTHEWKQKVFVLL